MHLLSLQRGTIADWREAVDLGQTPGRILVLSAADTELAALAFAADRLALDGEALRLANLLRLQHPMSVDTHVGALAPHVRLVVIRLLGGAAYWRHGCEAWNAAARRHGFALAVLPGDDRPDPGLEDYGTLPDAERERLWSFLREGGAANADAFLRACLALAEGEAPDDTPARPILKAGRMDRPHAPRADPRRPLAAVVFYRALVQSGQTDAVEALAQALESRGLDVLPAYVSGLKDPVSVETLRALLAPRAPDVVVNLTGFATSAPGRPFTSTVLDEGGAVVLQGVLAGTTREAWESSSQGLSARDLAMNVALPEVDGRVLTRALAFKSAGDWHERTQSDIVAHRPEPGRIAFTAELAARWAALRHTPAPERRIAILLANYPNRDGRIGNGVGLDTPVGTVEVLRAMREAGYETGPLPDDGNALIAHLQAGPTNAGRTAREIRETLPLADYRRFFDALPEAARAAVTQRWGAPEDDPFFDPAHGFALPLARFGRIMVGIQPARGYNIDPKDTYHAPDLAPPHGYLATYAFLRETFGAQAIVHMGKHGNLEWLPGKALALSDACFPEAALGPLPHLYPFIVNDPGEGTQAKRRSAAVIVDHLTPPLTRAESHGPARDLERLVDEYYEAAQGDPRRTALLKRQIVDMLAQTGLGLDAGLSADEVDDTALEKLDAWLCDLKEMQIRDGLHVFGRAPEGRLLDDLAVALARLPRGGEPGEASLLRALSADCGLGAFDPLDCAMGEAFDGARPGRLATLTDDPWRTQGDTVERLERLASRLVAGAQAPEPEWAATGAVLAEIATRLKPAIAVCGDAEIAGLLAGLDGRFVPPGPSGAPTRGRPDVLPTGRNFFSVDTRAVPTEAAWTLGRKSAELLVTRHLQDHGEWLRTAGLTCWGTANMRTGGDDIAQALALIGARPTWDRASGRVTGFEILPPAALGRPRVDVTLRVSGFFRDAFPDQIALFDRAVRAVGALDEDADDNPVAARMAEERRALEAAGLDGAQAQRQAGYRVFGSKPGAYGAGLQALIDEGGWQTRGDLAESFLHWGAYAYGADVEGASERAAFETRLAGLQAVIQNQDNREHDLLDSDDYYQFEGGMSAAVEHLSGRAPVAYHPDHSRPERPVIRTLDEEIARVVRARAVNPKWIAGVMRHGYKGAFEMAATVDYLFAFAATTNAVADRHFDLVHAAYLEDAAVAAFLRENNPAALAEMRARFRDAIARGLWRPRSNSAQFALELEDLTP